LPGGKELQKPVSLSLSRIKKIVALDLSTTYQTLGDKVFIQKKGCPIGGYLSAIYATAKCSFDENNFLKKIGNLSSRIFGNRCMDDLGIWIAYKKGHSKSFHWK